MLGDVDKLIVFKILLTMASNVLPLQLKQTFPPIIWIFTEGEGDGLESRLPFKIFSSLFGDVCCFLADGVVVPEIYKLAQIISILKKTGLVSYDYKTFIDKNGDYPRIGRIKYLAENKFFSFLIDETYGGIKLSVNELSNLLTKITSLDPALGVVAMVPSSLGPGELLTMYGTEDQKNFYLKYFFFLKKYFYLKLY